MDERSKCLIFGYNRRHSYGNVPIAITYLCVLYYFDYGEWDKSRIHSNLELMTDNVMIKKKGENLDRCLCTAYLKREVETGIHKWKFKIIKINWNRTCNYVNRITIGALNIDKCVKDRSVAGFPLDSLFYSIHFCISDDQANVGDIIEIVMDFEILKIKFNVNDGERIEEANIEPSKYKMFVCFSIGGDSIKLL